MVCANSSTKDIPYRRHTFYQIDITPLMASLFGLTPFVPCLSMRRFRLPNSCVDWEQRLQHRRQYIVDIIFTDVSLLVVVNGSLAFLWVFSTCFHFFPSFLYLFIYLFSCYLCLFTFASYCLHFLCAIDLGMVSTIHFFLRTECMLCWLFFSLHLLFCPLNCWFFIQIIQIGSLQRSFAKLSNVKH